MLRPKLLLPMLLLLATLPGYSQYGRHPSNFDNGLRRGGHGGQYNDPHYHGGGQGNGGRYDDRYRQQQGGIGPGKGALIGTAGGAVLGAVFGGGLKGTIIGGAAGAGIGAIVGKAHQNSQRNNYYGR